MTPEDILEKHGLINGFAVEAFTERVVAAMEEYANQFKSPESFTEKDMIGFAEWISNEDYVSNLVGDGQSAWMKDENNIYLTPDLLTKYLKQQKQ